MVNVEHLTMEFDLNRGKIRTMKEMMFSKKKEWDESSEWDMSLLSQLLSIIKHENIKFTVPIPDWAAALCIENMYSPSYPKAMRKNIFFNSMYLHKQQEISMHIAAFQSRLSSIQEVLKR